MPVYKDHSFRLGASAQGDDVYEITQSIRFNDTETAHMERTPSSTGNRKIFTSSLWVKLGAILENSAVGPAVSYSGVGSAGLVFTSTGAITLYTYYTGSSWTGFLKTNRLFTDPTAWYHIVYIVVSTQEVASERIRLYVNGVRETSFANENYLAKDTDTNFNNSGSKMQIGRDPLDSAGYDFDGYLAEMHYLDGYAYGPEYFGKFNDFGIWIPIEYTTGDYGTNGFHIDGRDASDLGDDESGNGNDFTTTGLAAHDQMLDTPNNNWCTMNSAAKHTDSGFTIANGNLELTRTAANNKGIVATVGLTSGKWYWEVRTIHGTSYNIEHGVIGEKEQGTILTGTDVSIGSSSSGYSLQFNTNDYYKRHDNSSTDTTINATSPSFQAIALDMDNKKIWFGYAVDGASSITWFESGNPAGGSNHIYALDDGNTTYYPCHNSSRGNGTQQARFNFGQDGSFAGEETATYTDSNGLGNFFFEPPSGFLAICTRNLFD